MVSITVARKSYARNLLYRKAHVMRTLASIVFGFIYVSVWTGVGKPEALGEYGMQGMISYIAFNQACIWLMFPTNGLGMDELVRTGQISLELMKPMHLYRYLTSREWGQMAYQFVYTSIPIYLVYLVLLHIRTPERPATWLYTMLALACTAYLSVAIAYLIGVTALWTTESRFLGYVHHSLNILLGGFLIPVEWLPGWLRVMAVYTPYSCLQYLPTRLYLEMDSPLVLWRPLFWCALLTGACFAFTHVMRRKLEVQGG